MILRFFDVGLSRGWLMLKMVDVGVLVMLVGVEVLVMLVGVEVGRGWLVLRCW